MHELKGKRRAHVCETRMVQASNGDRPRGCKRRLWRNPGKGAPLSLETQLTKQRPARDDRPTAGRITGRVEKNRSRLRLTTPSIVVHHGCARATRGMQETNSTSCSHSAKQVAIGAWIKRDRTRMTCSVHNCRAVLDVGGAHTVLTNNSLNPTRLHLQRRATLL